MHVLVTGGTGFLGGHVARSLLARGDKVRVLGRNPQACARLEARGVDVARGDLRDEDAVSAACQDMEAVVHAGALSAPWGWRQDFTATNAMGTVHVLNGCARHGVRRLVHISSPSVTFNGQDQENLTEAEPYPERFLSFYSRTKAQAERWIEELAGPDLEPVILRPKAIFGPGDTSLLPRLLEAARRNRLPQIGDGLNRVDLTYIDNVVDAVLLALTATRLPRLRSSQPGAPERIGRYPDPTPIRFPSPELAADIYTITNGESPRVWDVIRHVLRELGLNYRLRAVPYSVAYGIAALMEARSAVTGREPLLTRYTVAALGRTQTYDISAARRDLGYTPQVSISEGIERTLAALKQEPTS